MGIVAFELPLPSPKLSPNARVHWGAKSKAVSRARRDSAIVAASVKHPTCPWKSATLQYVFTFRENRNRDEDNLISQCKAYQDGIADAGIVENDYQLTLLPIIVTVPSKTKHGVGVIITQVE